MLAAPVSLLMTVRVSTALLTGCSYWVFYWSIPTTGVDGCVGGCQSGGHPSRVDSPSRPTPCNDECRSVKVSQGQRQQVLCLLLYVRPADKSATSVFLAHSLVSRRLDADDVMSVISKMDDGIYWVMANDSRQHELHGWIMRSWRKPVAITYCHYISTCTWVQCRLGLVECDKGGMLRQGVLGCGGLMKPWWFMIHQPKECNMIKIGSFHK